ncbi:5'-3' exoribonuclease, partial [Cynara cardunculus var. scolymus]
KEEDRLRRQYELEGRDLLPVEESEVSDLNVITPDSLFMAKLSKQLQTYIHLWISNNPLWKWIKVMLSNSNAHAEREHKIMSFIRIQRTCPGYNPNTSHVL